MFSYPVLEGTAAAALDALELRSDLKKKWRITSSAAPPPRSAADHPLRQRQGNFALPPSTKTREPTAQGPVRLRCPTGPFSPRRRHDWEKEWIYRSPRTYITTQSPASTPTTVDAKVLHFMDSYLTTSREGRGFHIELGLQKFEEMYLRSNFRNSTGGRRAYRICSTIHHRCHRHPAEVACINFMNLSTARSVKRTERRWASAKRSARPAHLRSRSVYRGSIANGFPSPRYSPFAADSLYSARVAAITGKQITAPLAHPAFWVVVAALILVTGFTASSYPASFSVQPPTGRKYSKEPLGSDRSRKRDD